MSDAILQLNLNPEAKQSAQDAIFAAVKEVFELDIKPEAVTTSPVTPQGYEHNIALHKKSPGGTGHNRESIDVEVTKGVQGTEAQIFTQSGYGGYLELGTSKMRPQPYLFPAFQKFAEKISEITGRNIRTIPPSGKFGE